METTVLGDCETPVAACSGWADPVAGFYADTSYPNQEFAENVRWALSMIFVRSSLDSGAPNVRLTQNVSDGFRAPLRQTRNFEHICVRRTLGVPQSKRCSDIKIEPSRDFRKFNDFV